MAAFATVDELETLVGPLDVDQASQALNLASAVVRAYCRQTLTMVVDEVVTLDGTGSTLLLLPETPVTDVTSVTVDGVTVTDYSTTAWGGLIRAAGWGTTPQSIVVTYSAGYAAVPEVVKAVVLAVAARLLANPDGSAREQLGSYNVSYAQAGFNQGATVHLLDSERQMLDPVRV